MNNSIVCSETYSQLAEQKTSNTSQEVSFYVKSNRPSKSKLLLADLTMAKKFLDLFGQQHTFQLYMEPKPEEGPSGGPTFTCDFASAEDNLARANNAGYAICFMVNEGDGNGRAGANVTRIRAIYVDLDGPPIDPVLACKIKPHVITSSSPDKYHAFWLCEDVPVDKFTEFQNSLIARFGGDENVIDLPRVMRLPGFFHLKGKPVMSEIYQINDLPLYTYDELFNEFPPVPKVVKKTKSKQGKQTEKGKFVTKDVYVDGERTKALTSHIGYWLALGKSEDEVETLAYGLNYKKFRPTLSDKKVDKTICGILKTDQRNNPHRHTGQNQNSNLPIDIAAEMQKLNDVHALVKMGGKALIMNEEHDPVFDRKDISFSEESSFHKYYANQFCMVTDEHGNTKKEKITKHWMEWTGRPTYKGVVFAPGQELKDYYNLYRGFATDPIEGDWSKMKGHIEEILCAGNLDHAKWLLAWMARIVQAPGGKRPGTTPVLLSEQGAGKGIFVNYFGKLFGTHYLQITQRSQITGKFNNHLKDALFVFCDEGIWGGDKESEGVLKGMITDDILNIEPKGINPFPVKNHINMIVASNEDWAIPADIRDRRFCALAVSNARRDDTAYFAEIAEQMDNGGWEAMHYDLLHMDISDVNLRIAPKTEALFKQMMEGFSSVECYWHECLSAGTFDLSYEVDPATTFTPSAYQWPTSICKKKLYSHYHEFASHMGYRHIESNQKFYTKLKKLYPLEGRQVYVNGCRIREMVIPVLEELRKDFDKKVGVDIDW